MAVKTVDTDLKISGLVTAAQLPTYIYHGADANVVRPADVGVAVWVGTVEPVNANTTTDFWVDTGGEPLFTESIIDGGNAASF